MGATVLVVDPSRLVRAQIARPLVAAGFFVVEAESVQAGLTISGALADLALVFCDASANTADTIACLHRWRDVPVVMLATDAKRISARWLRRQGAHSVLSKPLAPGAVVAVARTLTADRASRKIRIAPPSPENAQKFKAS